MEKIKNQATATLDRMSILQQRYRQHQEIMKSGLDLSRRTSNASQIDLDLTVNTTNPFCHCVHVKFVFFFFCCQY